MTDLFGEWIPDWMLMTLLDAMAQAPKQTFQILTKRPERASEVISAWLRHAGFGQLPPNIWIGTSAENQTILDQRLPWLIRTLAQVRFLSLEPLLGPITLPDADSSPLNAAECFPYMTFELGTCVDWVIIGGESGPKARPLSFDWVDDMLYQCQSAGIPAFVKQLGTCWARQTKSSDRKGGDPDEWPPEMRVRMFPGEAW
jgi:protein gp37